MLIPFSITYTLFSQNGNFVSFNKFSSRTDLPEVNDPVLLGKQTLARAFCFDIFIFSDQLALSLCTGTWFKVIAPYSSQNIWQCVCQSAQILQLKLLHFFPDWIEILQMHLLLGVDSLIDVILLPDGLTM